MSLVGTFRKCRCSRRSQLLGVKRKRLELFERVDRKQLSEADALVETQRLFAGIVDAEKQRDGIRK
jgi:hypothetical protein